MLKTILIIFICFTLGIGLGFYFLSNSALASKGRTLFKNVTKTKTEKRVIGFLPYWLVASAEKDYSSSINTLTYFGLTIGEDGHIIKMQKEQETEPGWYMLSSGGLDERLENAKKNGMTLSLLVFSADEETISTMLEEPKASAQNLMKDVTPIMKKYGFTDLNIDVESVNEANDSSRQNFTMFLAEIKKEVDDNNLGTLSIDISPTALIKRYLINPHDAARLTDYIVFMTYDYHYQGSFVTGPVAPLGGARTISEFDTKVAIEEALRIMPPEKIVLGLPLYGYSWETLTDTPRAAVIPGSGLTASTKRIEEILKNECETCTRGIEEESEEPYVIYKDKDTGTYYQIFYPDQKSTEAKMKLASQYDIGGVAVWALGYESSDILKPLEHYLFDSAL